MQRHPSWLREIDHTADVGIRVSARSLEQLFERTAWGMFVLLADLESVRPDETRSVRVTADDREALLVRWLSELNYLHQAEGRIFSRFVVRELHDGSVTGDVSGEPLDDSRHVVHCEIKAVTFHDLSIERVGREWRAQVIFDL